MLITAAVILARSLPRRVNLCAPCFSIADEKEKFDPTQFQESIVQGLNQTGTDLEAVAKFLDASGAKLDYRRYAETLFDILVAGGMLGERTWRQDSERECKYVGERM